MQDKETVDEAEEALTCKAADTSASTPEKKESTKDGRFAFKKMKQPRREKAERRNKPDKKKYEGEGIAFKAKLIGVESVSEARGDKMSQEAMQRLKHNVKNIGPHKRKIAISVSLQGIKIKDEKTGALMYHHPVSLISFISQDITDARAFGYVFGSTSEPHQFIAIKTEKPAFHVVVAIRDLFQTVLFHKQEEIDNAKEIKNARTSTETLPQNKDIKVPEISSSVQDDQKPKNENICIEVLLTEPIAVVDDTPSTEEPVKTVDDLLDLQDELNKLQQGIEQIDTSIAATTALNSEVPVLENDPFDTSFVLGPKRDSFAVPMPTPIPAPTSASDGLNGLAANGDKYAVFSELDSTTSIFEATTTDNSDSAVADMKELEEEIARKSVAPPKPPRTSKTDSADLSIFADLDPLGKDRPYKDKTEFFQDVKNPPKKVLNDLVDPNKDSSRVLDVNMLVSSVPFPVDFETMSQPSVNMVSSSSLPNAFSGNANLSLINGNSETVLGTADYGSKIRSGSEPANPAALFNVTQYTTITPKHSGKLTQQLNVNCTMANQNPSLLNSASSSPIPIPPRNSNFEKDKAFSNGSLGSPFSKSPQPYLSESPSHADYFIQNYNNSEGSSPTGYRNGLTLVHSGENGNVILTNTLNITKHSNINGFSNIAVNGSNKNGASRPRPRPSLNKGGSIPNGGRTTSSHSLSSDSSSDYEMISRENMQSITNVLLTNGHRLRAQSLHIESNNDFKHQTPNEKNIFSKKNDPFADDFFFSLPKKASHLTKAEIPEYV